MKKPMVKIHNVETGEVIEREMNAEELEQFEIDQAVTNAMKQASKRFSNPFVEGSNPSGCILPSHYFCAIFHLSPAYMSTRQLSEFLSNVPIYSQFC